MATKFPAPSWATETTHANLALEVRSGGTLLRRHELPRGRRVFVIGRQADVADVVVGDDETASRQHCAIVPRGERLYLIDLRSTRGTFVDGARLPPNEPTELSPGARLALSDAPPYSIELVGLPRAGLAAASSVPISMAAAAHVPSRFSGDPSYYNQKWDPDAAAARRDEALQLETNLRWTPPAWAVMGTGSSLAVNLVEGGEVVQALDLSQKKAYVLGRSREQADYVVPDESVSRQHAALMHGPPDPPRPGEAREALLTPWRCRCGWENRPTNGVCGGGRRPYGCGVNRAVGCPDYRPATAAQTSLHVADLGSTKGTFLDTGDGVWRRLQQQTPTRVPPGGRLRLGECETLVVRPAPPSQPAHPPTQGSAPTGAAALAAARAAAASRAADDKTSAYRKASSSVHSRVH